MALLTWNTWEAPECVKYHYKNTYCACYPFKGLTHVRTKISGLIELYICSYGGNYHYSSPLKYCHSQVKPNTRLTIVRTVFSFYSSENIFFQFFSAQIKFLRRAFINQDLYHKKFFYWDIPQN